MLYCSACKKYIQQIGRIPYEIGDICPECRGNRLIDKPEPAPEPTGFKDSFNGSGNAYDFHTTEQNIKNDNSQNRDSHDDNSRHYDNRGQVNVQGDYQVTQVAAQKSDKEVDLLHQNKGRQQYSDACRRFFDNDGVIDLYEENELTKIQIEYDLDINWCQQEKERIKALSRDNCSLSKSAKYDLEDLIYAIKNNDVSKAATYANRLSSLINEKNHEELQYFYHLTLATLQPEKCTSSFEKSQSHNYWHTFWSYLAYLTQNKIDEASKVHNSLDAYRNYPEDNDMLIRTAGECILGDNSAKRDFARIDEGYSPVLRDLYNSIAIIVRPDIAQREGLFEKDYLFYLKYIFNYETAEEREKKVREEQEKREAEERRLKAEAEAKAAEEARIKAEQEAKRKAEEERRRKEEEAKRQREAEEARRREEARRKDEERRRLAEEARMKAAEEARIKAEQEAKRKAEEERKRKEAEENKRAEEARKKAAAEAAARNRVTYSITITGVTNQMLAMMTLRSTLGWGSADSRQKLSKIPFVAKQFNDEHSAIEFNEKLSKGGMTSTVTAINGLGEAVDCSIINGQAQVAAYKEQERRRKEAEERRNQETRQKELDQQRKSEQNIAENRRIYEDACKDVYADGVMTSNEKQRLDALARTLGLSNATCEQILSKVKGSAASKQQYDVTLIKPGAAKLSVVKTVMDVCHLGIKESKDLVDGCPSMLKEGLTKPEAEKIKRALEAVGAEVKLI